MFLCAQRRIGVELHFTVSMLSVESLRTHELAERKTIRPVRAKFTGIIFK